MTTFDYELEETGFVTLTIFNNTGQEVITLANEQQSAGRQRVQWDAKEMPAGIYFFRLTTNDQRPTTKKVVKK